MSSLQSLNLQTIKHREIQRVWGIGSLTMLLLLMSWNTYDRTRPQLHTKYINLYDKTTLVSWHSADNFHWCSGTLCIQYMSFFVIEALYKYNYKWITVWRKSGTAHHHHYGQQKQKNHQRQNKNSYDNDLRHETCQCSIRTSFRLNHQDPNLCCQMCFWVLNYFIN